MCSFSIVDCQVLRSCKSCLKCALLKAFAILLSFSLDAHNATNLDSLIKVFSPGISIGKKNIIELLAHYFSFECYAGQLKLRALSFQLKCIKDSQILPVWSFSRQPFSLLLDDSRM